MNLWNAENISLIGKKAFKLIKKNKITAIGGCIPVVVATLIEARKHNYELQGFTTRKTAKIYGAQKLIEGVFPLKTEKYKIAMFVSNDFTPPKNFPLKIAMQINIKSLF